MITLYEPICDKVTIDDEIDKNIRKLCFLSNYDVVSVISLDKENKLAESKKVFMKQNGNYVQLNKNWTKIIEDTKSNMLDLFIEKKQILFYKREHNSSSNFVPFIDNAEIEIYIPIFLDLNNRQVSGNDLIACVYLCSFNKNNIIEIEKLTQGEIYDVIYNLTRLYEITYLMQQKRESVFNLINMMSEITREKEPFIMLHPYHVAQLSKEIGQSLNLNEDIIEKIYFASLLHDIGKIYLDRNILNKQGSLSEDEYSTLKNHSTYGANIVKGVTGLEEIASLILYHHERYDGKGYPKGLKGEKIPLESRIICVADAVDAMFSHRSYRNSKGIDFVISELVKNKGKQFDPKIVDIMISILTKTKDEINNIFTDAIAWSTLTISTIKKTYSIEGTLRKYSFGCFFKTEKFNFLSEIKMQEITNVSLYIHKNNNEIVQYQVTLEKILKENKVYLSNFKYISLQDSFKILWGLVGELYIDKFRPYNIEICQIGGNTMMFSSSENLVEKYIESTLFNVKIFFEDNTSLLVTGKIANTFKVSDNIYYDFIYINIKDNVRDEIFRQIFRKHVQIKRFLEQ